MPQAITQADFNLLQSYSNQGAAGRLNYYNLLEAKGYNYATLAKGVVTGTTPSGAAAIKYADNVAKILEIHPNGLSQAQLTNLSTNLMELDWAARKDMFEKGQHVVNLGYQPIRDYHTEAFADLQLPPQAWTVFVPFEYSGLSAAQKETRWQELLQNADGGYDELLQGLEMGVGVFANIDYGSNLSGLNITQQEAYQALWTQAMFWGVSRSNPDGAMQDWMNAEGNTTGLINMLESIPSNIVVTISVEGISLHFENADVGGDVDPNLYASIKTLTQFSPFLISDYIQPLAIPVNIQTNADGSQTLLQKLPDGTYLETTGQYNGTDITLMEESRLFVSSDAVVKRTYTEFDEVGQPVGDGDLSINFKGINYQGELAGQIFGSQLGALLGDGNVFAEVGLGTLGSTIAGNIGEFIGNIGQSLLAENLILPPGETVLSVALDSTFNDIGADFTNALSAQMLGALNGAPYSKDWRM